MIMNSIVEIRDNIDFTRAMKNPFAKIAKAARKCNGKLPNETSEKMLKEAIEEIRKTAAGQV